MGKRSIVFRWTRNPVAIWLAVLIAFAEWEELVSAAQNSTSLEIRSVAARGKPMTWRPDGDLRLGPFPESIVFNFRRATNSVEAPIRVHYKLEGFDEKWREGFGEMYVVIRFLDENGDRVAQKIFPATGESAGWSGTLKGSTLTHRRETFVVPPRAVRFWLVISSGGPPATVGLFVVDDLVVSRLSSGNGQPVVLLRTPSEQELEERTVLQNPLNWARDGLRPSMAKVVELGQEPKKKALAIWDEDPYGHAEWHNTREYSPRVAPDDTLVVEWNEVFSMGVGNVSEARYEQLPPGRFRFRVQEVTSLGVPTGVEASLAVYVPLPMWERPWFWATLVMSIFGASAVAVRYLGGNRMRREVLRLKQQRGLEQERLRIAQDIHDDLGARVTQISLLSAMAQGNAGFPEKARADFDRISRMCRELVSALYETVWAVNPENDNLDALGNYLCQKIDELCQQAQLRCRMDVKELPHDVQVSSQTRHNLTMAVKEAAHNIIKHAKASELILRVAYDGRLLTVSVDDNGCGFDPGASHLGSGLTNMKRRLEDIGGSCLVRSQPGEGATVKMQVLIQPPN